MIPVGQIFFLPGVPGKNLQIEFCNQMAVRKAQMLHRRLYRGRSRQFLGFTVQENPDKQASSKMQVVTRP